MIFFIYIYFSCRNEYLNFLININHYIFLKYNYNLNLSIKISYYPKLLLSYFYIDKFINYYYPKFYILILKILFPLKLIYNNIKFNIFSK